MELEQWDGIFNTTTQLHVSSLYATSAYNLDNSSILSVEITAPAVPFNYSAADVMAVLEIGFLPYKANESNSATYVLYYIAYVISKYSAYGVVSDVEYRLLRNILALPLYSVNQNRIWPSETVDLLPNQDLYVPGYLAKDVNLVLISDYSLYTFTVLALLSLLWCACVLVYCWVIGENTPNISQYPEFDFASKCKASSGMDETGMAIVLEGLGNSNSTDIENRIQGTNIFVRAARPDYDELCNFEGRVVLATNGKLEKLKAKKKYL